MAKRSNIVYSSDLEKYDITNEPWASGGTALVIGNGPSANIVFKHGPGLLKKIDKKKLERLFLVLAEYLFVMI